MSDALISYPFVLPNRRYPLRLNLPSDLRKEEVDRLVAFLKTLVIPEEDAAVEDADGR